MRTLTFILAALVAVGCRQGPKPDKGMAAVQVKVIAEPKVGVKPPPEDPAGKSSYGPFSRVDYSEVDHIVVWVEPVAPGAPPLPAGPINTSVDPQKSSHGLDGVVCVGQTVVIKNAGQQTQAIYSASDGNDFALTAVPPGGTGEFKVRTAGLIEIFAESSKDIAVQLYAAPTPWAQIGRAGQTLDFNNIPPGRCRIVSWHHRLPGTSEVTDLAADKVTQATITVGVNSLPKVGSAQ